MKNFLLLLLLSHSPSAFASQVKLPAWFVCHVPGIPGYRYAVTKDGRFRLAVAETSRLGFVTWRLLLDDEARTEGGYEALPGSKAYWGARFSLVFHLGRVARATLAVQQGAYSWRLDTDGCTLDDSFAYDE